jgi:hypothetical protein
MPAPTFNYVQVSPQSTGLKIDTSELTSGSNTVDRQNIVIADPTIAANVATVSPNGNLNVAPNSTTGTHTNPTITSSSSTIVATSTSTVGVAIYNSSTVIVFLGIGFTPTSSSYTIPIEPNVYFEVPYGFSGIINAITAGASGAIQVTVFS